MWTVGALLTDTYFNLSDMTTFNDIEPVKHFRGQQRRQLFPNGWGVSVIPEYQSDDLYEVAVMRHDNGRHAQLTVESGLFGPNEQVSRRHTVDQVDRIIQQIETLPDRNTAPN